MNKIASVLPGFLGLFLVYGGRAIAQIIPDRTVGSEVNNIDPVTKTPSTVNQYIRGGTARGRNLFHSFQEFNIDPGKGGYFVNPGNIDTIFSRVTGNNPSLILGTLGITKGNTNPNLFFINPRGIVFGNGASLDINGAFVATTANNIKFPDGTQFSTINPQGAPLLTIETSTPIGLEFVGGSPGAIINAGNLESGSNLSLISGTVVSAGKLSSPQGDLSLVSVPETTNSIVQLEATGEFTSQSLTYANPNASGTGLPLPELVRYGNLETGLTIDNLNRVTLPDSEIIVNSGDIAIAGRSNSLSIGARSATLFSSQNLTLFNAQIAAKEDLNLLANDTVLMRDTQENPLAIATGQDLLVRGDLKVDILALKHSESELAAGNNLILRSGNEVDADANFWSGGSFRIEKLDGNLGNLFSPRDPIIRSLGDVSFDTYLGASLHIIAGGSVKVNTILIIGSAPPSESINPVNTPDLSNVTLLDGTIVTIDGSNKPTLDIRAGVASEAIGTPLKLTGSLDSFFKSDFSELALPNIHNIPSSADININTVVLANPNSMVLLTNRYEPNLKLNGDINLTGSEFSGQDSNLFVESRGSIILDKSNIQFNGNGNVKLLANDGIDFKNSKINSDNSSDGNGTDINLFVARDEGNITLDSSSIRTSHGEPAVSGKAGDIKLESDNISLQNQSSIGSSSIDLSNRNSGAIDLSNHNSGAIKVIANLLSLESSSNIGTSTQTSGNANNIKIEVGKLSLQSGSSINSITSGENSGRSGNIDIDASDSIIIKGYEIIMKGSNLEINLSQISTNAFLLESDSPNQFINSGITITTPNLFLEDEGKISIDASNVASNRQSFSVDRIEINSDLVKLDTNAIISADAIGIGNSGQIEINAVRGISLNKNSQIVSSVTPASQGNSGGIRLNTPQLNLTNNSSIVVDNQGSGAGGNIFVDADRINLLNKSKISAENTSNTGGNIELKASNLLLLRDGSEISTNGGIEQSLGDGGNISINANFIVAFPAENSDITTNAYLGNGGNINITTNKIFGLENRQQLTPFSDITAISEFGLDGNVKIDILGVDPTQDVATLPQNTVNPQVKQGCQASNQSNSAEFYYLGKTGLINSPERLFTEEIVGNWIPWTAELTGNNSIDRMEGGDRNSPSVSSFLQVSRFRLPCQTN